MKDGKIIHHIHIPKCGGSSIKRVLESENWTKVRVPIVVGQENIRMYFEHVADPVRARVSDGKLYTGHEHREIWSRWDINVEFQFTVFRNPYSRFHSHIKQYISHQDWYKDLKVKQSLLFPVDNLRNLLTYISPGYEETHTSNGITTTWGGMGDEDNHYRPQHQFVGQNTACFKIESDMPKLLEVLKERNIVSANATMPFINSHKADIAIPWNDEKYKDLHQKFIELYKGDFKIPGYNVETSQNWNGELL